MKIDSKIHFLLTLLLQTKIFHWQTKINAKHLAFDSLFNDLLPLIDTFAESAMGKYGRFKLSEETKTISLMNINEVTFDDYTEELRTALVEFTSELDSTDTDLLNIRDEILGLINKNAYLLSFKY